MANRRARFPIYFQPTRADVAVARSIGHNTSPAPEGVARALTWGANEKVLLVLAAVAWPASRGCGEPPRAGNHALLVTVAASLAPWFEAYVRPEPAGSPYGHRARPRRPVFRQT
jgi:hypothetical protein